MKKRGYVHHISNIHFFYGFPNEAKWPDPEYTSSLATALNSQKLWTNCSQKLFSFKTISQVVLIGGSMAQWQWLVASHLQAGNLQQPGTLLWASETIMELHRRTDVSIWGEQCPAHSKHNDTARRGVDYSCKSWAWKANGTCKSKQLLYQGLSKQDKAQWLWEK